MKKILPLTLVIVLLVNLVMPVKESHANKIVNEILEWTITPIITEHGYKLAKSDQARDLVRGTLHKLPPDVRDNVVRTIYNAKEIDVDNGSAKRKWTKVILPTALIAETAGVLYAMYENPGEVITEEGQTELEMTTTSDSDILPNGLWKEDIANLIDPITGAIGIEVPWEIYALSPSRELWGFEVYGYDNGVTPSYPTYYYSLSTPWGKSVGFGVKNRGIDANKENTFAITHIKLHRQPDLSSGSARYDLTVGVESEYFDDYNLDKKFTVVGKEDNGYVDITENSVLTTTELVQWLMLIGAPMSDELIVPEFDLDPNKQHITPYNSKELEVVVPTEEGIQEIFDGSLQKYLDTLNANPNITNETYITNLYEGHQDPDTDPIGEMVPETSPEEGSGGESGSGTPNNPDIDPNNQDDLNFEPLKQSGVAFTKKFPFSLPWDIKRAVESLVSTGEVPTFTIAMPMPSGGLFKHEIEIPEALLDFVPFVRGGLIAVFLIGLIFGTRKLLGGSV